MAIVILGSIQTEPGKREGLLAALRPVIAKTRTEEPGCVAYAFTADNVDPDLVLVYENWMDEASLDAHFRHPNMVEAKQVLKANGAGQSQVRKYRVDDGEPVKDAEGRYRADFFTEAPA
jgi:quinol monooxygenase YgiN